MIRIIISSIAILFIFNTCSKLNESDFTKISDPQARWNAYGYRNYNFDQAMVCFCLFTATVKVIVEDNRIVNVSDKETGLSLLQNEWQRYKTVDELFELISGIKPGNVAAFHVTYDKNYGYRTSIYVDPSANIADEEYSYESSNLHGIW